MNCPFSHNGVMDTVNKERPGGIWEALITGTAKICNIFQTIPPQKSSIQEEGAMQTRGIQMPTLI